MTAIEACDEALADLRKLRKKYLAAGWPLKAAGVAQAIETVMRVRLRAQRSLDARRSAALVVCPGDLGQLSQHSAHRVVT